MWLKRIKTVPLNRFLSTDSSQRWVRPVGHETGIQVYNCVAEKKVPVITRYKNMATFYTCGPTVYDDTHIGHASCYVKLDIIQRILRDYFNINLLTAMNITDIDDKIIRRGQELKKSWTEVAKEKENDFWECFQNLNIQIPSNIVRVTDHLQEIENFIQKLMESGYAYKANDESVYFDCKKFPSHGKLTKNSGKEEEDYKSHIKRSRMDFALWKSATNTPNFVTQFGSGRPGWHIECSAMASKLFGNSIDFHAGGWDLIFPHHENEETQSCAFHGTNQWVNYWIHTGQLRLKGDTQKMSKSLKNTISVKDLLKNYSSDEFRMFCLLSNYQSHTEFSDEGMMNASSVFKKFRDFQDDLNLHITGKRDLKTKDNSELFQKINTTISSFDSALRDDFDTAKGLKALMELMSFIYKGQNNENIKIDNGIVKLIEEFYQKNLALLGLQSLDKSTNQSNSENVQNHVIESVLKVRRELKKMGKLNKNQAFFEMADLIRNELHQSGIVLKDRNDDTTTWTISHKTEK